MGFDSFWNRNVRFQREKCGNTLTTSFLTSFPLELNVLRPLGCIELSSELDVPALENIKGRYEASCMVSDWVLLPTNEYRLTTTTRRNLLCFRGRRTDSPSVLDLLRNFPFCLVLDLCLLELYLRFLFCSLRVLHKTQAERAIAQSFGHGSRR